jgi:hypothetical protein
MAEQSMHEKLTRLHAVILEERECAKALDMDKLTAITKDKEELLLALNHEEELNSQDRVLAETIRAENRRNAYLFWAALNWIQESMAFFGKKTAPAVYSSGGSAVSCQCGGRLLSGKV